MIYSGVLIQERKLQSFQDDIRSYTGTLPFSVTAGSTRCNHAENALQPSGQLSYPNLKRPAVFTSVFSLTNSPTCKRKHRSLQKIA